jgi:type I restriction enzyme S subunit
MPFSIKIDTRKIGVFKERLNIGVSDFLNIDLYLPSLTEQTRIANFLSALDDKINHTQMQIEKTEVWKKGLLQKMFV